MNLVIAQVQDIDMFLAKAAEMVDIFLPNDMSLPERPPFKGILDNLGDIVGEYHSHRLFYRNDGFH
jgi:hypothetical protein